MTAFPAGDADGHPGWLAGLLAAGIPASSALARELTGGGSRSSPGSSTTSRTATTPERMIRVSPGAQVAELLRAYG